MVQRGVWRGELAGLGPSWVLGKRRGGTLGGGAADQCPDDPCQRLGQHQQEGPQVGPAGASSAVVRQSSSPVRPPLPSHPCRNDRGKALCLVEPACSSVKWSDDSISPGLGMGYPTWGLGGACIWVGLAWRLAHISDWGLLWLPWSWVERWPRKLRYVTCREEARDLEGPCSLPFCLWGGRQGLGLALRPGGSPAERDSSLVGKPFGYKLLTADV